MMARNTNVPIKGRIQKRKTNHLQIVIFGLQRAAGPYRRAIFRPVHRSKNRDVRHGGSIPDEFVLPARPSTAYDLHKSPDAS
jgi:hypothetical protein